MRATCSSVSLGLAERVDPDDAAAARLPREARDHPGLGAPGDGAHDDRVEENAELPLLLLDLLRPLREAETAQPVVRRAGRDGVRPSAAGLDVPDRPLPAFLEPDPEPRLHEPDVRAHHPAQQDVAHPVVDGVGPVHPALLDQHASHPDARRGRRHLPGVVRLDPADGDERVAPLRDRLRHQVLELPDLVAAEREPAVAVIALRPDPGAAQVRAQALQRVDRRRAEQEGVAGERGELHACSHRPGRAGSRTARRLGRRWRRPSMQLMACSPRGTRRSRGGPRTAPPARAAGAGSRTTRGPTRTASGPASAS